MWVFLSGSFLSIVDERAKLGERRGPPKPGDILVVRSRRAADLRRLWPDARVERSMNTDYRFRVRMRRSEVARTLAEAVLDIDYGNFKDTVSERDRASAYMSVWGAMFRFQDQQRRPPVRQQRLFEDELADYPIQIQRAPDVDDPFYVGPCT